MKICLSFVKIIAIGLYYCCENVLSRIFHMFCNILFIITLDARIDYEQKNCHCTVQGSQIHVGPYCKKWMDIEYFKDKPPFCLLKGDVARYCPGAVELVEFLSLYYTTDPATCNKSEKGTVDSLYLELARDQRICLR